MAKRPSASLIQPPDEIYPLFAQQRASVPVRFNEPSLMKNRNWGYWLLLAIAVITIISGAVLILAPDAELQMLQVELTPTTAHFFATIGMFMVLFGAVLAHSLVGGAPDPVVVFWTGWQKLGASAAVGLGVMHHIFSPLALLVAAFDGASGVVAFLCWCKLKRTA
jgi:uncharacterized protein YjeT (DUF2065 family)